MDLRAIQVKYLNGYNILAGCYLVNIKKIYYIVYKNKIVCNSLQFI